MFPVKVARLRGHDFPAAICLLKTNDRTFCRKTSNSDQIGGVLSPRAAAGPSRPDAQLEPLDPLGAPDRCARQGENASGASHGCSPWARHRRPVHHPNCIARAQPSLYARAVGLEILSNALGNLVFWLAAGLLFWVVSRVVQRRVIRFFGLDNQSTVTITLSNLWSPTPGATQAKYMISLHESWASQSISSLFGRAPLRLPDIVRGFVDSLWLRSPVQVRTLVSNPLLAGTLGPGCNVVVGAAKKNRGRSDLVAAEGVTATLDIEVAGNDVGKIHICLPSGQKQTVTTTAQAAIVERVRVDGSNTFIFTCLGSSADGTWCAVEYLSRHWKELYKRFGAGPFVVCLAFPRTAPLQTLYTEPLELASFAT